MKFRKFEFYIVKLLYLIEASIIALQVLGYTQYISILFGATFIVVVCLWLYKVAQRFTWIDGCVLITICCAVICVLINASAWGRQVSFQYLRKLIMFAFTLLFFVTASKIKLDVATMKFIFNINSILAIFLICYYYSGSETLYLFNGYILNSLTFGFDNPNFTAMVLLHVGLIEVVNIFWNKSLIKKIIHFVLAAAMFYFVVDTDSRTCLISLLIVLILTLITVLKKGNLRLPKVFIGVVAILPIIVVFAYLVVVETSFFQKLFVGLTTEGKGLDSRVVIWNYALQNFTQSPIVGAYYQISGGMGISQMHNTHMDILTSYGIIVFCAVCYILVNIACAISATERKYQTIATICFLGTLLIGIGEATLFSGGLGVYILAGMFIMLSKSEVVDEVIKSNEDRAVKRYLWYRQYR